MSESSEPGLPAPRYWRRNLCVIVFLLALWLLLTVLPSYFARDLFPIDFFGWPLSFWMAAHGAPLGYLILIGVYARLMNRADARAADRSRQGD